MFVFKEKRNFCVWSDFYVSESMCVCLCVCECKHTCEKINSKNFCAISLAKSKQTSVKKQLHKQKYRREMKPNTSLPAHTAHSQFESHTQTSKCPLGKKAIEWRVQKNKKAKPKLLGAKTRQIMPAIRSFSSFLLLIFIYIAHTCLYFITLKRKTGIILRIRGVIDLPHLDIDNDNQLCCWNQSES